MKDGYTTGNGLGPRPVAARGGCRTSSTSTRARAKARASRSSGGAEPDGRVCRRGGQPGRRSRAAPRSALAAAPRLLRSARRPGRACRHPSSPPTSRSTRPAASCCCVRSAGRRPTATPTASRSSPSTRAGHAGRGARAARRLLDRRHARPRPRRDRAAVRFLRDLHRSRPAPSSLARVWREPPPPARGSRATRSAPCTCRKSGEDICGDDWDWRHARRTARDHGRRRTRPRTARPRSRARRRSRSFQRDARGAARAGDRGRARRAARDAGAAVAMVAVDLERGVASYCGLGNISAPCVIRGRTRHEHDLAERHGGHTSPAESRSSTTRSAAVDRSIMYLGRPRHRTGIWRRIRDSRTRHPSVIAGVLYRDFSRRRDDVTVVVVKASLNATAD